MSKSEKFVDKSGCTIWISDGNVNVINANKDIEESFPLLSISSMAEDPGLLESSLKLCVSGQTGAEAVESGKWVTYDFDGPGTAAQLLRAIQGAAREFAALQSGTVRKDAAGEEAAGKDTIAKDASSEDAAGDTSNDTE